MNSAPFFIVASGRSGTTLLRLILASHSRLSIPPETWYLNRLTDLLEVDRALTQSERERVIRTMTEHYRWPDLQLDTIEFKRDVASMKDPKLSDIVELVYQKHLEREHKVRWGDKTPGYIALVPQLAKMFPGAKFIHLIRDGRDVSKSFQLRRWNGRRLHDNAREWLESVSFRQRWRLSPVDRQILDVRYEDLVLDPHATVSAICAFLGEQFEPQMLNWQERADELVPSREAHIHEKLTQTPNQDDVHRWKRELSAREVLVCEAFMGDELRRYGYELRFGASKWKPVLRLTQWYCKSLLPIVGFPARAFRYLDRHVLARSAGSRAEQ